jgi:hypothetical protein
MLADAVTERVPFRWVGGNSTYGNSPTFVQGVRQLGKWYVLDTSSDAHVWTEEPQVIPPEQRLKPSRGRPYTQPLVIGTSQQVVDVIATLPFSRPRGNAASTSTRPAAGSVGIIIQRSQCWPSRSLCSNGHGWGKKGATDDRARGASSPRPPAGRSRVGRGRNPMVVPLAAGAELQGRCRPSQATPRRAATALRAK